MNFFPITRAVLTQLCVNFRKMKLNPRESGEFIVANSKHVKVQEIGIKNLSNQIIEAVTTGTLDIKNFSQHEFHPKPDDSTACNWIFLIDTLNFCFWTPGKSEKYNVEGNTGYFALCAAINRAMKDGIDVTNPKIYSEFSLEDLANIFRSDDGVTKIPLLEKRQECLQEVGRKLVEKYDGDFKNVIATANGSAKKFLETIVEEFPCFRDEADYKGKRVSIYKRAQILVGDIYACYQGEGLGHFVDINETITMFADYRVPQVLVHFGALVYNEELSRDLKADRMFENGEEMEVEIRGASIYIVEKAKEITLAKMKSDFPDLPTKHMNSILIDHFLWDYRRANAKLLEYIPFHKTTSIYY